MEMKTRAPNFTTNEVETLIDLLYSRPELANGKIGKHYKSQHDIMCGWEYIADIINEVGIGYKRSAIDIKKKWKDVKFTTKKKANKIKAYRKATGSDPPPLERLTNLEQKIVGLINLSQTVSSVEYDTVNQTALSSENSDNEMSENPDNLQAVKIESVESIEDHLNKNKIEAIAPVIIEHLSKSHPVVPQSDNTVPKTNSTARVKAYRDRVRRQRDEEKNGVIKELIELNSEVLKHLERSNDIKYNMLQEMKLSNKLKVAELKIKCKVYNLDLNVINAE